MPSFLWGGAAASETLIGEYMCIIGGGGGGGVQHPLKTA